MVLLNAFNSISILELSLKSMGLSNGSIERFAVNCDKIDISTNEVFLIIAEKHKIKKFQDLLLLNQPGLIPCQNLSGGQAFIPMADK